MIFVPLIVIWIVLSFAFDLNSFFLPDARGVIMAFFDRFTDGSLPRNVGVTLARVLVSVALAAMGGIPLGLAASASRHVRRLLMPIVEFARGIPTSMLFPVFIILIGFGEEAKVAIVLYSTLPVFIVGAFVGGNPRSETAGRREYLQIHREQVSPLAVLLAVLWEATPSIVSSTKVAVSLALVLVIVTEMFFVANIGVGWAAFQSYHAFAIDEMYMYVLVVGLIGLGMNLALDWAIRRVRSVMEPGD